MEPKEISSRLIPRPLVVFTRLLEILVTTLTVRNVLLARVHLGFNEDFREYQSHLLSIENLQIIY